MNTRHWTLVLGLAVGCAAPALEPTPATEPPRDRGPTDTVVTAQSVELLEAPARVLPALGSEAHIGLTHEGTVARVWVAPGDRVEAGAPIVELILPEVLDAAARWTSVGQQRRVHAQRRDELDALRDEGLVERGPVVEQDVELASLDRDRRVALAVLRSAGIRPSEAAAVLGRGTVVVRSPIAGLVTDVDVVLGESRSPSGRPLAQIRMPNAGRVEARLAGAMPTDSTATFVAPDGTRVRLLAPIAESLDTLDGTTRVYFEVPANSPVQPGPGRLVWTAPEGAVEFDARCLRLDGGGPHVERVSMGGEREEVRVELLAASRTRVLARGVAVGESLALDPASDIGGGE